MYIGDFDMKNGINKTRPFVRKVLRYRKNTVFLSVGSIIPKTWKYVIVRVLKREKNTILLEIKRVNHELEKLIEEKENET